MKTFWFALVFVLACGASQDSVDPETEYRCDGPEIQQFIDDEWVAVAICYDSYGQAACSVDPEPACL
jgi:hypothetical protein